MKLIILFQLLIAALIAPHNAQQIPETISNTITRVNSQVNILQAVLNEFRKSVLGVASWTGSRVTSGLQTEQPISAAAALESVTNQLSTVQVALAAIDDQLTAIGQSRLVGGAAPDEPIVIGRREKVAANDEPSTAEMIFGSRADWLRTAESLSNVLSDLNSQWNRILEQGSRLVSGQRSDPDPDPETSVIDSSLDQLEQTVSRLLDIQRVLGELTIDLNRLIDNGQRIVAGQSAEDIGTGSGSESATGPAQIAFATLASALAQVSSAQRVLVEMNNQLNRMVVSSSRLVSGQDQEDGTGSGASAGSGLMAALTTMAAQFVGIQHVLGELTAQLNRMLTTGSRLVTGR